MLTLADVARITGGTLLAGDPALPVPGISTDSRSVREGELFVPLRGERFDGHTFLPELAGRGVACLTADEAPPGMPAMRVVDTLMAYGDLARAHRFEMPAKIVAVTGSSGKTSTKEAIATLLSAHMPVHKSAANFNNEIGVPRTLLELTPEHRAAVVEMGMRGPGEIAYLTEVARPDVGVLTNIGTAHIGRLGSQEAIARAKGELFAVDPHRIAAAVNGDDELAMDTVAHLPAGRVVAFGFGASCTLRGSAEDPQALEFEAIETRSGRHYRVRTHLAGEHHRRNALAALAVALILGVGMPEEIAVLPENLAGRSLWLEVRGMRIVDESYNANPESMIASLSAFCLQAADAARRVAVLGAMAELGEFASEGHRRVGEALAGLPFDLVVTVGESPHLRTLGEAAGRPWQHLATNREAAAYLGSISRPGDAVLIKGSRSNQMEEIVSAMSQPACAAPNAGEP